MLLYIKPVISPSQVLAIYSAVFEIILKCFSYSSLMKVHIPRGVQFFKEVPLFIKNFFSIINPSAVVVNQRWYMFSPVV